MKPTSVQCPECGMLYVLGLAEDMREHEKFHDKRFNGVPARQLKTDRVIYKHQDIRITVVNHSSPISQKKIAQEVAFTAHKDTPFDFAPYHYKHPPDGRGEHIFLLYCLNRIVGLLILEKRSTVWKFTWKEYDEGNPIEPIPDHPPLWTVGFIWVVRSHRRNGLAKLLVTQATQFMETNIHSIGWYPPLTESGQSLVRHLCPDYFYFAKGLPPKKGKLSKKRRRSTSQIAI